MHEYSWNSNLEDFDADFCVEGWALSHKNNINMNLYQIKNYGTLQGSILYIGTDITGRMTTLGIQTRTETNHNYNYCGILSVIDSATITDLVTCINQLKAALLAKGIKPMNGICRHELRKEELISNCDPCDKIQSTILIIHRKIVGVLISKNNMLFATGSVVNHILPLFQKASNLYLL